MKIRVGFGYDVHPLRGGLNLILGGVSIPYEKGLKGHSDADVLLHAIIDALLGAAALGDIGRHFPPEDHRLRGISSLYLLKEVAALLGKKGFKVGNIDSTIVAQRPRLSPYIEEMRTRVAETLGIKKDLVSIKATTTEKLGFPGREEGMAAYAVVLLEERGGN